MVLITTSWRMWLAGLAVSLAVFGVLYFTVIRPDNNTANQAIKSGLQQSQQALNQAQQQLSETRSQTGVASSKAQQELSKASKLSACAAAAGTDATKLQACKTRFAK
jgi:type II secretory pathway component PulM